MKENSKYKKETLQLQRLPSLAMLSKDKRYRYRDSSKERVLRGDIDSFIHDMVGKENKSCSSKFANNHHRFMSNKINLNHEKFLSKM